MPPSTSRAQISGKLVDGGAEHVDALPAGDLGVKTEVAGDLADQDQLLGCQCSPPATRGTTE